MSRTRTIVKTTAATAIVAGLLLAGVTHAQQAQKTPPAPQAQPPAASGPGAPAEQGPPAGPPPGMRGARQPGRGPMGPGMIAQRLELTQAQQDQLKTFRDQHQKDVQAASERVRAARQTLREAMQTEAPDEAAVRTAGAAMAGAQVEMMALQARSRGQFVKMLTPEQRQKFGQMQEGMRLMRDRWGQGGGMMGRGGMGGPGMGRGGRGMHRQQMGPGQMGPRPGRQMRRWMDWI